MGKDAILAVVPTLNEQTHVRGCLSSLLEQKGCLIIEIIVVDGGSTDATVPIVMEMQKEYPLIRLIHNYKRFQSAAVNLAAAQGDARASVILRADAHAKYRPDFVAACVEALRAHNATSVVVPLRTVGHRGFQRAVAAAQNCLLGNGGAPHRRAGQASGFVSHGHHAAFDRAFFTACSGYDETFSHNEDAELDYRAVAMGGRIWLEAGATIDYFPRDSLGRLSVQYLRIGRGRARTFLKHRLRPGLRQILPVLIVPLLVASTVLGLIWWQFALFAALYVGACVGVGLAFAMRGRDPWLLCVGPVAITMHISYGFGFLQTVLKTIAQSAGSRLHCLQGTESGNSPVGGGSN